MKKPWVLMIVAAGISLCAFGSVAQAQQLFIVDSAPKVAPLNVQELFIVDQMPDVAPTERIGARAPLGAAHLVNLLLAKPANFSVRAIQDPRQRSSAQGGSTGTPGPGPVDDSTVDLFFGYSYLSDGFGGRAGIHGGHFAATWNAHHNVGLTLDLSGNNGSTDTGTGASKTDLDQDMYFFLFGPKFTHHAGNFQMFAQVLAGITRAHTDTTFGGFGFAGASDTNFAMGGGGGLDYMASPHWGWRVIQADFLYTQLKAGGFTGAQANVRISTGLIARW